LAKPSATLRPMPRLPPHTTTLLPVKSNIRRHPLFCGRQAGEALPGRQARKRHG
jgi:hypothetical protein